MIAGDRNWKRVCERERGGGEGHRTHPLAPQQSTLHTTTSTTTRYIDPLTAVTIRRSQRIERQYILLYKQYKKSVYPAGTLFVPYQNSTVIRGRVDPKNRASSPLIPGQLPAATGTKGLNSNV